jgi:hypothetical protein
MQDIVIQQCVSKAIRIAFCMEAWSSGSEWFLQRQRGNSLVWKKVKHGGMGSGNVLDVRCHIILREYSWAFVAPLRGIRSCLPLTRAALITHAHRFRFKAVPLTLRTEVPSIVAFSSWLRFVQSDRIPLSITISNLAHTSPVWEGTEDRVESARENVGSCSHADVGNNISESVILPAFKSIGLFLTDRKRNSPLG